MSNTRRKRKSNKKKLERPDKTTVSYLDLADYCEENPIYDDASTFRNANKVASVPLPKNKKKYSLSELMDMNILQSIYNYSNVNGFKEALSSFLMAHYRKLLTLNQDRTMMTKIYSLLKLLRKENPTISSNELDFLKSLASEKTYYIEK